jgi:hypothetical protein
MHKRAGTGKGTQGKFRENLLSRDAVVADNDPSSVAAKQPKLSL